eukprot:6639765-Pyramimonas_sp.AAC.1
MPHVQCHHLVLLVGALALALSRLWGAHCHVVNQREDASGDAHDGALHQEHRRSLALDPSLARPCLHERLHVLQDDARLEQGRNR